MKKKLNARFQDIYPFEGQLRSKHTHDSTLQL